ncbi:TPA: hypothetical protein NKQ82_004635 [Vibrio parahaemolyticus]|nr:hypothetical protein [Vibrio parahaemolyticus]
MKISTKIISIVTATLILLPLSVKADASGWQEVGRSQFKHTSVTASSGGGNFRACLEKGQTWKGKVMLWEKDPNSSVPVDPFIAGGPTLGPGQCAVWYDLNKWKDGDNDKAEFYITKESDGKTIKVIFQD